MKSSNLPTVSFIIPTLNAEAFLPRCLAAILHQNYPHDKIEIIVADAHSTDKTREIARHYQAKLIDNPEILHEPGKTLASAQATGQLLFYTDADNVLADHDWLTAMVKPYIEQRNVVGLLPQTTPPPDSSSLNRYLSYLFTDPLTWFIYGAAANPATYQPHYLPTIDTNDYKIYRFQTSDHPLFGLSQGTGVARSFQRGGAGRADDILSGIQLIEQGGLVAYVPAAKVYHYHVENMTDFARKYRWRTRNNLQQQVKGMGILNRLSFFNRRQKLRLYLFLPYTLTLILPAFDSIRLCLKWHDRAMLWHLPTCFVLTWIIITEYIGHYLGQKRQIGIYGK